MRDKQAIPGRLRASHPGGNEDDLFSAALSSLQSLEKNGSKREQGAPKPRVWICQLAVALTQASFVVGSVYLKGSLSLVDTSKGEVFHPIVYAFAREAVAGPILYLCAWLSTRATLPARQDYGRVAILGACMFFSQLFYITGIELSGVVIATCMQPTIPVFTVLIGVVLQMETANPQKLTGIALAVAGSISMVLGGSDHLAPSANAEAAALAASRMAIGNVCLLVNTLAMACYYIQAKRLVAKYAPVQVAAWAYLVAATLMGTAAALFTSAADWNFPHVLIGPLIYWIIVCSIAGYYIVTWAMRHLPASQVASFQCLQPLLGSVLAFVVLHERLSIWDLGAIGVVAGLLLVSLDRKDMQIGAVLSRLGQLRQLMKNKGGGVVAGSSAARAIALIKELSGHPDGKE